MNSCCFSVKIGPILWPCQYMSNFVYLLFILFLFLVWRNCGFFSFWTCGKSFATNHVKFRFILFSLNFRKHCNKISIVNDLAPSSVQKFDLCSLYFDIYCRLNVNVTSDISGTLFLTRIRYCFLLKTDFISFV